MDDHHHDDRGASAPLLTPLQTKTMREMAQQENLSIAVLAQILIAEALQARRLRGAS